MKIRSLNRRGVFLAAVFLLLILSLAAPVLAKPQSSLALAGIGTVTVNNVQVEAFDLPEAWEHYSNPNGTELGVEQGVYRAYTPNPGYAWGLNTQAYSNLVSEVEITPLTIYTDTAAGVMCRADTSNNGDGYYFMINGNGYYSIRIGRGADVAALVDWQRSKAIHSGIDRNTVRAVCLNHQLAMYVNGTLVAQIRDDTYSSGYVGLAIAAGDNGVDMAFDNLTLYSVQVP
jgi:hypothetical protein